MSKSKSTFAIVDPLEHAEKRAYADIDSIAKCEHAEGYLAAQYRNFLYSKDNDSNTPYFCRGRETYNHYLNCIANLKEKFGIPVHSLTPLPSWD